MVVKGREAEGYHHQCVASAALLSSCRFIVWPRGMMWAREVTYRFAATLRRFHDYVPPSVGWPMEEVISTLVTFALYLLRPGGRLVFFLPTDNAEYSDLDVPSVPGLRLVSNSLQSYGKWGRRLITMEKARDASEGAEWRRALEGLDRGIPREGRKSAWEEERGKGAGEEKRPGHADFNRRYFAGFDAVKEGVRRLVVGDKQSAPAETPQ